MIFRNEVLEELYSKMIDGLDDEIRKKGLAYFVGMAGKGYGEDLSVRLMLIGRTVNGWSNEILSKEEEKPGNTRNTYTGDGNEEFKWVRIDSCGGLTAGKNDDYRLSRSPFWRTAKQVLSELSGEELPVKWVDDIAWSNLYKVAPRDGGNPDNKLCAAQIEMCKDILQEEIRELRPTHIFMPVGWSWFCREDRYDFSECFEEVAPAEKEGYIEGMAYYRLPDGHRIPVIVACRPERRPEKEYVRQIADCFRKM